MDHEHADVVVIGGGIIGASAAYYLAKSGRSVTLCEKGRIAGEQSSRNWGFVRQQGRDPAEIPLIIESMNIWRGLAEEIGEDVGFRQSGTFYLAADQDALAEYEKWREIAKTYQLDTEMLPKSEIDKRLPGQTGTWAGAMTTPSDGKAEPALAAPAIARAAERAGAKIIEGCSVRGLQTSGGRVSGVVTETGEISANAVILAGGAWSSRFLRLHGMDLPQLWIRDSVLRTGPAPEFTDSAVWTRDVAFRRRADGGYTVAHGSLIEHDLTFDSFRYFMKFRKNAKDEAGRMRLRLGERMLTDLGHVLAGRKETQFEAERVLDPAGSPRILNKGIANLRRLFPALKDVEIAETWAGWIDVTPDAVPVISPAAQMPGLIIATGFSGHGFGIGPGAGKLAAELATGDRALVDPKPFREGRF